MLGSLHYLYTAVDVTVDVNWKRTSVSRQDDASDDDNKQSTWVSFL